MSVIGSISVTSNSAPCQEKRASPMAIVPMFMIEELMSLSASIKSDREVFQMNPFVWIPANPKWDNYPYIRNEPRYS